MHRSVPITVAALAAMTTAAQAQHVDLTLFVGRAFPVYDERLTVTASPPSLPGIDVTEVGRLEVSTEGRSVFGGALAFELGVFAVEGRLDATDLAFRLSGVRYDLVAVTPPFTGRAGSITISSGRFDIDRLRLVSLNARLRTPGAIGLVASGGLSYLPGITFTGSVPLAVDVAGVAPITGTTAGLRVTVTPGEPRHRWGLNGGVGLRVGSARLALMGEVRAFYFREFELHFATTSGLEALNAIVGAIRPIRFEPVIVNAQGGLVLRF